MNKTSDQVAPDQRDNFVCLYGLYKRRLLKEITEDEFKRGNIDMCKTMVRSRVATERRTGVVKDCASCGRRVRTMYGDLTSGKVICATCWKGFCTVLTGSAGLILLPVVGARHVVGLIPAVEAVIEAGCGAMMAWEMVEKAEVAEAQPQEAAEAVAKALAANAAMLAKGKMLAIQPEDVGGTVAQVKALVKALEGAPTLRAATVAAAVKSLAQVLESPKVAEKVAAADPSRAKKETSDIDGEMAEVQLSPVGVGAGGANGFSLAGIGGLIGAAIGGLVGASIGGLVGGVIGGLVGGFSGAGIGGIISEGR